MTVLNPEVRAQARARLAGLEHPVRLSFFTQDAGGIPECEFCAATHELVEEVTALSSNLRLEVLDFVSDSEAVKTMRIDKIPAVAIRRDSAESDETRIRMYGIPAGYEFGTFLETLLLVGGGEPKVSPKTVGRLSLIQSPIHIQVYTTPT